MARTEQCLRFLPVLQVNKLSCHRFMKDNRKHESPGSEMKDHLLLTAIVESKYQFAPVPQASISTGCLEESQMITADTVSCITEEEP